MMTALESQFYSALARRKELVLSQHIQNQLLFEEECIQYRKEQHTLFFNDCCSKPSSIKQAIENVKFVEAFRKLSLEQMMEYYMEDFQIVEELASSPIEVQDHRQASIKINFTDEVYLRSSNLIMGWKKVSLYMEDSAKLMQIKIEGNTVKYLLTDFFIRKSNSSVKHAFLLQFYKINTELRLGFDDPALCEKWFKSIRSLTLRSRKQIFSSQLISMRRIAALANHAVRNQETEEIRLGIIATLTPHMNLSEIFNSIQFETVKEIHGRFQLMRWLQRVGRYKLFLNGRGWKSEELIAFMSNPQNLIFFSSQFQKINILRRLNQQNVLVCSHRYTPAFQRMRTRQFIYLRQACFLNPSQVYMVRDGTPPAEHLNLFSKTILPADDGEQVIRGCIRHFVMAVNQYGNVILDIDIDFGGCLPESLVDLVGQEYIEQFVKLSTIKNPQSFFQSYEEEPLLRINFPLKATSQMQQHIQTSAFQKYYLFNRKSHKSIIASDSQFNPASPKVRQFQQISKESSIRFNSDGFLSLDAITNSAEQSQSSARFKRELVPTQSRTTTVQLPNQLLGSSQNSDRIVRLTNRKTDESKSPFARGQPRAQLVTAQAQVRCVTWKLHLGRIAQLDKRTGHCQVDHNYLSQQIQLAPAQPSDELRPKAEYATYWQNEFAIAEEGGLICTDMDKLELHRSLAKHIIKEAGSNLFSRKSITNISLPVSIFCRESMLERLARSLWHAPNFLERAATLSSPEEQIKLLGCFFITVQLSFAEMGKPFNPILGQTLQVWLDGCPIYLQQVSHHPPVSSILYIGRGFRLSSTLNIEVELGLNGATSKVEGEIIVQFEHARFRAVICNAVLGGLHMGNRTFNLEGFTKVYEERENLLFYVLHNADQGGFWSAFGNKEKQPSDYFAGLIVRLRKGVPAVDIGTSFSPPQAGMIQRQIAKVNGRWPKKYFIDGAVYFDAESTSPVMPKYELSPLPSDSCYREDLTYLRLNKPERSQQEKVRLEEKQRGDRRLRSKAS